MGEPVLDAARVPFDVVGLEARRDHDDLAWPLAIDGQVRWVSVLSMGNPHAVQLVEDVDRAPVASEGPLVERHARFPQRVNSGYMQIVDRHAIRLRVWERGAGETLACGTGACAAVVTGIRRGRLASPVSVAVRGGTLTIEWSGGAVRMTGPATKVFEGEIEL
jgi:diaminopimelate epimerase